MSSRRSHRISRRAKAVQPGDGALDYPAEDAQARAVLHASFGDDRADAALPQKAPVLVVVVVAVGKQRVGRVSGSADDTGNRREVLAVRPCAVDRAGSAFGPLRAARTWEESITARDQSSFSAARSLLSSKTRNSSPTPASFQAARRRRQVIPEPKPSSRVRYSHWMPVCGTSKIPHKACRSGIRGGWCPRATAPGSPTAPPATRSAGPPTSRSADQPVRRPASPPATRSAGHARRRPPVPGA